MTAVALVLAPLTCAAVLLLSGVAKARDLPATRAAFAALSVPPALRAEPVVRGLPYVEIGLALLLLGTWSWPLAVVAAVTTVLFACYWVLVLLVLRRGEDVDCGCFGAVGDDRVTRTTLLRNSVLVVLAGLATGFGAAGSGVPSVLGDLSGDEAAWLLMAAATAATSALVVGRGAPAADEAEDVDEGDLLDYDRQPIPFALLSGTDGERTTLRALARERPQLLVFLSSSCYSCVEVARRLPAWQEQLGPVQIQCVYTDALDSLPANVTAPGIPTWYDVEQGASATFAASGRPAAVLLGADGQLAGGPVAGTANLIGFVEDILGELAAGEAGPQPDGHEHGTDHGGHEHGHGHEVHDHRALEEHDHQH